MDEKTPRQLVNANLANVEQARIAAEDVSTDPELLRELARSQDKDIRRAVAANPNTPADVLLRLGAEFPEQLVENPVFSLLLLENPNLVAEIPLPTLRSILRLDNVPQFILEQAADKADVEVQLALANNIQTTKKVLERLTQSRDAKVAESARLHVNFAGELTLETLKKLAQDSNQLVCAAAKQSLRTLAES
jgi:Leucine rich repeat variant